MKTILDVERLVKEYAARKEMKIKYIKRVNDTIEAETLCYTKLNAKLNNGRITFKVDGKRTSLYN